jgi:signal transduction histidine kinase
LRAEQLAAVGQLAASIAHEVRNPLTSIKLLVEVALNGKCGKALTPTDLQVNHDEIVRLERKVQGLLDFARPVETERVPQDRAGVIRRVGELAQERLRQQGVTLNLDLPRQPLSAELDLDQFQSVLVNLVFNALDAMPRGDEVHITLTEEPAGQMRLEVRDTGPGLDANAAARLFMPFFSPKPTGTGLGLTLSKCVVEAHGGTLTACKGVRGACFGESVPLPPWRSPGNVVAKRNR